MAAPKNKYGVGSLNPGRPTKFDKKEEAEELLKWASQDDAFILRMFAPLRGYSTDTLYRWVEEDAEFRHAYNIARDLIGTRRELRLIDKDNATPFNRYATMYDDKLHKHERDEKLFDAKVAADTQKDIAEDVITKSDAILAQLQEERQERKIADIKANDDQRS